MASKDHAGIDPLLASKRHDEKWVKQYMENRYLNLGDCSLIETVNPFDLRTEYDLDNPHVYLLDLMRRPENITFACSILFNKFKRIAPFQAAIYQELWKRPFPMLLASRGASKSWLLALYSLMRCLFEQGRRIVIVGAAFRQAKVVFDYAQDLYEDSPILQSILGPSKTDGPRRDVDRCSLRLGDSLLTAFPLGDGSKIRGQRASITVAEEFASIPVDIFERVVRGFGSVSMDPVNKMSREFSKLALKELGLWTDAHEALEESSMSSNQTIISGTAYYTFNHFYEYWRRYKSIIESRGDQRKLDEIFNGKPDKNLNWKDYSVIRIPADVLPAGFMDAKMLAQARATVHSGTYAMEYQAIFAGDSNGFFKRSLIESCVVGKPSKPIAHKSCGVVNFHAVLKGDVKHQYVIAADPASERDNFSLCVLECRPDHRRLVYSWTTTRSRFKAKEKRGLTDGEHDFYGYASRKMRDVMADFPTARLAIDSQGGGVTVMENLQDPNRLREGERPIYPVIDPEDPKDTDGMAGDHILEIINFASGEWVSQANHGMRKDFEDKVLLFPEFNSAILGLALEEDKQSGRIVVDPTDPDRIDKLYDTLDDCVCEIEETKEELATIVHTQTGQSLRDRWDTPETKVEGGKKGRLRKDRYSALLMANMVARVLQMTPKNPEYTATGGFARDMARPAKSRGQGPLWIGPAWWVEGANQVYDGAIVRKRLRV